MAPKDEKYVVFDRHSFSLWLGKHASRSQLDGLEEIPDSVVIRRQDMFAPPALHTYANSLAIAARLADATSGQAKQLQRIADYFHEQAVAAEAEAYKLPD